MTTRNLDGLFRPHAIALIGASNRSASVGQVLAANLLESGFKGPVMAPAPTGDDAVRLWDAVQVLSRSPGFFEITRPRANPPRPPEGG